MTLGACDASPSYTVVDSFDDCHLGLYFAECGPPVGDPVFGCETAAGSCRWFSSGAVPREVELVSTCPADDICCVENWPFESVGANGAYELFYALDTKPWDRVRAMSLEVITDPSLTAPAASTLTCTGTLSDEPGIGPCDNVDGVVAYDLHTPAIAIYAPGNFYGWNPFIEIDEPEEGDLRARVCIHRYTDVSVNACEPNVAICATSGTVTIDRWPLLATPGTVFHLEASFADGSTLVGDGEVATVL